MSDGWIGNEVWVRLAVFGTVLVATAVWESAAPKRARRERPSHHCLRNLALAAIGTGAEDYHEVGWSGQRVRNLSGRPRHGRARAHRFGATQHAG
ncbi:MAG: hypothetical protein HYV63_14120 [Candidatus Schekmanbacteria bacterium]|nr:hypothetical protein [Candidatus Schekmanbacteria bacterium]